MIRSLCLAAATVLALAGSAHAQNAAAQQSRGLPPAGTAAATLPNAFDRPAPVAAPVAPTAAAATAGAEVQMAEAALRAIIEQIQAGDLDESLFTPDLATRLNGQLATFTPMVLGFGELETIEAQGAQDGVGQFLVTFETAATQWRVGLNEDGRVAALLFREAPPESSEPSPEEAPVAAD